MKARALATVAIVLLIIVADPPLAGALAARGLWRIRSAGRRLARTCDPERATGRAASHIVSDACSEQRRDLRLWTHSNGRASGQPWPSAPHVASRYRSA
jgi:hypothetical protein